VGTRKGKRGWEILAAIITATKLARCDGRHPVTVMERAGTFSRERRFSVLR